MELISPVAPAVAGAWLPSDQGFLRDWLDDLIGDIDHKAPLKKSVDAFHQLIEDDPQVYMLFNDMLWQLSHRETPTGSPQVKTVDDLLQLFNTAIQSAPRYNTSGLVGFPINAILNWAMGTQAGFAAFLNDKVNACFKDMLDEWAEYLTTDASKDVLDKEDENSWFGEKALEAMPDFEKTFVCDPTDRYYGFTSWDDFFTRRLKPGVRPVASGDAEVANACESVPYRLATKVRERDTFWLKGQPYALAYLLDSAHRTPAEPDPDDFVGGTVYQAFLSALNYHRWHSPVDGTVRAVRHIPGTYYSQTPVALCDVAAPDLSQGYIAHLAARAVVYIDAEKPAVGTMAFVAIGMAEVSSCDVTVGPGDEVERGQEIGTFHYGGSTHCLVFGPDVDLEFVPPVFPGTFNLLVNTKVATLK
ncbi:phosphatidylserine decarboxylase family protein [Kitasatospora sp. NPDC096204]|uniref:phosphatidylserine decarboxylase family protein n=1 Tax=Kitasatospora sp. NPDC096204 TaxID=3364094 RepID=UPI0038296B1D